MAQPSSDDLRYKLLEASEAGAGSLRALAVQFRVSFVLRAQSAGIAVTHARAGVLQAAESSGAAILYSKDLATGQRYGSIRVVNPPTDSASPSAANPTS